MRDKTGRNYRQISKEMQRYARRMKARVGHVRNSDLPDVASGVSLRHRSKQKMDTFKTELAGMSDRDLKKLHGQYEDAMRDLYNVFRSGVELDNRSLESMATCKEAVDDHLAKNDLTTDLQVWFGSSLERDYKELARANARMAYLLIQSASSKFDALCDYYEVVNDVVSSRG